MSRKNWSKKENRILRKNFYSTTNEKLQKLFPDVSLKNIKAHAFRLCIKRQKYLNPNKNKLKFLLKDNPITYYWLGFLMADGHFRQEKSLQINLSYIDKEHLQKFANLSNSLIRIRKNIAHKLNMHQGSLYVIRKELRVTNKI